MPHSNGGLSVTRLPKNKKANLWRGRATYRFLDAINLPVFSGEVNRKHPLRKTSINYFSHFLKKFKQLY